MTDTPILILLFNRPDKSRQLYDALRKIQPRRLFVAADGPRPHKEGEAERCEAARAVFQSPDWDCELRRLYRGGNLGCKMAVSGAIDWFFDQVEEGIILEDDCIPTEKFVLFATAMLRRYRRDERLAQVAGHNPIQRSTVEDAAPYFFSRMAFIWGWATWADRWKKMDLQMRDYPAFAKSAAARSFLPDAAACGYLLEKWEETHLGRNDSWAYAWLFHCVRQGQLCLLPKANLIHNVGFDEEATHTRDAALDFSLGDHLFDVSELARKPSVSVSPKREMQLFHTIFKNKWLLLARRVFGPDWVRRVGRWLDKG